MVSARRRGATRSLSAAAGEFGRRTQLRSRTGPGPAEHPPCSESVHKLPCNRTPPATGAHWSMPQPATHFTKLTRRDVIEIGYSTVLGTGLAVLTGGRSWGAEPAPAPRAKSVLFVFLFGGPSHLDTSIRKPKLLMSSGANSVRSTRRSLACESASTCQEWLSGCSTGPWSAR